jgi:hypothetical protein
VAGDGSKVRPRIDVESDDVAAAVSAMDAATSGPRLRLRADLIVGPAVSGKLPVRAPESPTFFSIYDIEWQIAKLLDGSRGIGELTSEIARRGLGATPQAVRAFVRELEGYGFLDNVGSGEETRLPAQQAAREQASPEASVLFDSAMAMRAHGDYEKACDYLLAVLEIEPGHHVARDLLRHLQLELANKPRGGPAASARTETAAADAATVTTTGSSAPAATRRSLPVALIASIAALVLVVVVGVAALLLWPHPRVEPPVLPDPPGFTEPRHDIVKVQLKAIPMPAILAPDRGVLMELAVQPGQAIAASALAATLITGPTQARVEDLWKKKQVLAEKARHDRVFLFYLDEAERNLQKALRSGPRLAVAVPQAGRIGQVRAEIGTRMERGAVIAEMERQGEFAAEVPGGAVIAGRVLSCRLVSPAGIAGACNIGPERAAADGHKSRPVQVTNPSGELAANQWVDVEVLTVQ